MRLEVAITFLIYFECHIANSITHHWFPQMYNPWARTSQRRLLSIWELFLTPPNRCTFVRINIRVVEMQCQTFIHTSCSFMNKTNRNNPPTTSCQELPLRLVASSYIEDQMKILPLHIYDMRNFPWGSVTSSSSFHLLSFHVFTFERILLRSGFG